MPTAAAELLSTAQTALQHGDWTDARRHFEEALAEEESPDARLGLGEALWWLGQFHASLEERKRAYAGYRARGDRVQAASVAVWMSISLQAGFGNLAASGGWAARAERLLDDDDPGAMAGWALLARACGAADAAVGEPLASDALSLARRFGDTDLELCALSERGWWLVAGGKVDEGFACLDEAAAGSLAGEVSHLFTVVFTSCTMLVAATRCGDFVRAVGWVQATDTFIRRYGGPYLFAHCRSAYGGVLLATGAWEEAEHELLLAVRASEGGTCPPVHAEALGRLCRLWVGQGRVEEAAQLLSGFHDETCTALARAEVRVAQSEVVEAISGLTRRLSQLFLGDLYQDLSEHAKSTYALLQTPEFVEEFILDRTLTPAMETFGLAATTLIDPTCGSGHFLLGGFDRLWRSWRDAEPGTSERLLAQRALDQVTGVDLNPFAAAIARFRLLVAAVKVSGIKRLADGPDFTIDVAVGDSLLWGARPGQFAGMEAAATAADRQFLYRTEHAEALRRIFDRRYTAVVGNPPYIVARDKALNVQYRERYPLACSGKYSLAAPFMQCFFDLAVTDDGYGIAAGHVGMITTNLFMKRQSGKKLIENLIPTWDLTHVVDTSLAEIEGHNQTAILFGRHQRPLESVIRTAMGIRGESSNPGSPPQGLVWAAILRQIDEPGSESDFISVSDIDRTRFASHPWSIGGGGAAELKEQLDHAAHRTLARIAPTIGVLGMTNADDVMIAPSARPFVRALVEDKAHRPLVVGDAVRDWHPMEPHEVLFPYGDRLLDLDGLPGLRRWVWPCRTIMGSRATFARLTYFEEGRPWWEWHQISLDRLSTSLSILFAEVATHNHFVLDRGGKVFKQTAPLIKLADDADPDDYLGVMAILNSAVGCFWMKQACYKKTSAHGGGSTDQPFTHQYAFNGTALKQFPFPFGMLPVELARTLDQLAAESARHEPSSVAGSATPTRAV